MESKDIKQSIADQDKASSMGIVIIAGNQVITSQNAGRRNKMNVKDRNQRMQIQKKLC